MEDGDFRYDADNQTLTFQTNQFSDCAIAYKDVKKSGQTGRNDSNGTKKDKPTGIPQHQSIHRRQVIQQTCQGM